LIKFVKNLVKELRKGFEWTPEQMKYAETHLPVLYGLRKRAEEKKAPSS
jgi:hypothetical protein